MTKNVRALTERLNLPPPGVPFRRDQIHLMGLEGADTWHGCKYMAGLLFQIIREGMIGKAKREIADIPDERAQQWGDAAARAIFATWGRYLTPREMQQFENQRLLDRYDAMTKKNIRQLARERAEENRLLPAKERRGAGGTDPQELEQHIRRLVRSRKSNGRDKE